MWFCLGGNQNELAANANAVLKVGTLTIDGGGTLGLHGTGTGAGTTLKMYIGEGGLNIASGKATLRINGDRLRGGDHVIVSGVSEGAASHLNVELADSVKDGRRYEVAVKDGNLVLNIVSPGLVLFVR